MRRRALMAASRLGGKLPDIPEGLFPLYLTSDYKEEDAEMGGYWGYVFPTNVTLQLKEILTDIVLSQGYRDGDGYFFDVEDSGIDFYVDGVHVEYFGVIDGYDVIDFGGNALPFGGTIHEDGTVEFYIV